MAAKLLRKPIAPKTDAGTSVIPGAAVGTLTELRRRLSTAQRLYSHLNCYKQPAFLLVVIAGVAPLPVDIALVAAHRISVGWSHFIRHDHTAVIDSAVASGCNAKVNLQ